MAQQQSASQSKSFGLASRIVPLDGVRGVGMIFVLSAHTLQNTLGKAVGTLGLNSFFVLSGFLITSLLLQEKQRTGKVDLRAFYGRRFRRIFPVYYAFLAVVGAASMIGIIHIDWRTYLYDVFYLRNYSFNVPGDWWTGHSWSLAVEEQFYLFWPALLVFGGLRVGWPFVIGSIVSMPFVRIGVYHYLPYFRPYLDIMLPTRIDTIMFGCALGILFVYRSPILDWFTQKRAAALAGALAVATVIGFFLEVRYRGAYRFPIGITLEGVFSSALVIYLVKYPGTVTSRFLSLPFLTSLGRMSYSLYLWQQLFLTPHHLNGTITGRFPFNVVAAVALGALSYYVIERRYFRPKPLRLETVGSDVRPVPQSVRDVPHAPDGALEPG